MVLTEGWLERRLWSSQVTRCLRKLYSEIGRRLDPDTLSSFAARQQKWFLLLSASGQCLIASSLGVSGGDVNFLTALLVARRSDLKRTIEHVY
mmetsp:Transcript_30085/g.115460  ORF Transcript_30085/g.115460 Transcript_30085/m.115460 type:complete len:93 (+) Transcript_30085:1599-1877(+)